MAEPPSHAPCAMTCPDDELLKVVFPESICGEQERHEAYEHRDFHEGLRLAVVLAARLDEYVGEAWRECHCGGYEECGRVELEHRR